MTVQPTEQWVHTFFRIVVAVSGLGPAVAAVARVNPGRKLTPARVLAANPDCFRKLRRLYSHGSTRSAWIVGRPERAAMRLVNMVRSYFLRPSYPLVR